MRRLGWGPWPAVFAAIVVSIALSALARAALGARGELVPSLLVAAYPGAVAAFIGLRWLRGAADPRLTVANRRIVAALAVVPLGFAAFFAWQAALVAVDLASPFETVSATVVGTRYTPSGRGPGIDHLYTADGAVFSYPVFAFASGDLDGPRTITLSRYQHLVIEVR